MSTCVDVDTAQRSNRTSYIISLTNLKSFKINNDSTVTFGAGWDLVDLIPALHKNNLAVANLGTERVQNYVGAVTTGTHGTGRALGNLATQVVGLRVAAADGTVYTVNKNNHAEWLPAFRVSLGALGIIVEVTVKVQKLAYLKRTTEVINATSNFTKMYTDIYHLYQKHPQMMVWGPHMTWNNSSSKWDLNPKFTIMYWEPSNFTGVHNCSTNYCSNGCGNCLQNSVCYDDTSDAISTPPAGVCNRVFYAEIEHFIPIENFINGTVAYTNLQLSQTPQMKGYNNLNMIYELRFVMGDDNWMSPVNKFSLPKSSRGIFAVIEIDWYPRFNNFNTLWFYQSLAKQFIQKLGTLYNARPHWGKMSWFNASYAQKIYPKLPDFLKIQLTMDPNCQFVNSFLVEHLGITRCSSYVTGPEQLQY